jgi:hypothetical protein
MNNFSKRDKSILVGLYFSKFDKEGLITFGFGGFTEAFNVIGLALGVQPASLKNYRDEFDPLFPNERKGWHKRSMRDYCKKIYTDFSGLSLQNFTSLLKQTLYKDHELDVLIEELDALDENENGTFAKRLLTGQAAEQYFLSAYKDISFFNGLEIKDATKFGCGFDFKLYAPHISYAVEVKGLNDTHGNIMLTAKEHTVASRMGERYFLFVVRNFKEKPLHDLYKNPVNGNLIFNKNEQQITQTSWTTRL